MQLRLQRAYTSGLVGSCYDPQALVLDSLELSLNVSELLRSMPDRGRVGRR
jgi:hypothetical protein